VFQASAALRTIAQTTHVIYRNAGQEPAPDAPFLHVCAVSDQRGAGLYRSRFGLKHAEMPFLASSSQTRARAATWQILAATS